MLIVVKRQPLMQDRSSGLSNRLVDVESRLSCSLISVCHSQSKRCGADKQDSTIKANQSLSRVVRMKKLSIDYTKS
jgi:hypothetical protein